MKTLLFKLVKNGCSIIWLVNPILRPFAQILQRHREQRYIPLEATERRVPVEKGKLNYVRSLPPLQLLFPLPKMG